MPSKAILIQSEGLGRGDDRLGVIIMANFLRLLGENQEKPAALIFLNAGVRLLCEGSKVLEHLKRLEGQGIELLACTTCLEYLELIDKIKLGKTTTMGKIIQSMFSTDMICL